jgi:hypothetical protein
MRLEDRPWAWQIDVLWVLFFGLLSSAWCVSAGREIGATYDEPFHLTHGLDFWRHGSFELMLNKGLMPLPVAVCTLPVRIYEIYRGTPIDLATEFHLALPIARAGTLFFWWLLLVYGYIAGRRIGGSWGGRLAVALLACEPTLLANAALATTDLAIAACLLVFAVHYRANQDGPWLRRVGLCGLLFGIALLTKVSTLPFGGLIMLTLEAARVWERQPGVGFLARIRTCGAALFARRFVVDTAQIGAIGLVLTIVVCGSGWHTEPSFVAWAKTLGDGVLGRSMVWLSENLAIFGNAGVAIVRQIKHNAQGHGWYLLGMSDERAVWYFFPVSLAIKLSLPLLLLPIVLAVLSPASFKSRMFAMTAVLLVFSLTCRVQIGVRLLMPLIAFLVIGIGAGLGDALARSSPGWRRRGIGAFSAFAIGWMAVESAAVWPNGLCYVNEAWGGTANAYKCVGGSDNDWGQGLPELGRWSTAHDRPVSILYYGADPLASTERFPLIPFDKLSSIDETSLRAVLGPRDLAVSVCLLYGAPMVVPGPYKDLVDFMRSRPPVARTQTFFLFRFEPTGAQAQNGSRH